MYIFTEGTTVDDCIYACKRVRDRYEMCRKMPLNSNIRRISLQSVYTLIAPILGDKKLNAMIRVLGAGDNRQAKVGLRRAAERVTKLKEMFHEAGDEPLDEEAVRTLSLTGGGMHAGHRRSSPQMTEEQQAKLDFVNRAWDEEATALKGYLRVSPTATDAVRYRVEGDKDWRVHYRVELLDTATNYYHTCINNLQFYDPKAIQISGFRTPTYKSTAMELLVRRKLAGIIKVQHRKHKHHCNMTVQFDCSDNCTKALTTLVDVVDRTKLTRLTSPACASDFELECPCNGFVPGDHVVIGLGSESENAVCESVCADTGRITVEVNLQRDHNVGTVVSLNADSACRMCGRIGEHRCSLLLGSDQMATGNEGDRQSVKPSIFNTDDRHVLIMDAWLYECTVVCCVVVRAHDCVNM